MGEWENAGMGEYGNGGIREWGNAGMGNAKLYTSDVIIVNITSRKPKFLPFPSVNFFKAQYPFFLKFIEGKLFNIDL